MAMRQPANFSARTHEFAAYAAPAETERVAINRNRKE